MRLPVWLVALFLLLSLPAEAKRRRGSRSSGRRGDPALTNVGVSVGLFGGALLLDDFHVVSGEESLWYAGGWIGGTYHPRPEKVSPFMAVGTEIGVVVPPSQLPGGERTRTGIEVVPSARLGVSMLSDDLGHLFPDFEAYVLGGYRIPNSVRGHALRLGAGISIPAFARAQYKWIKVPFLPWMFDIIYDLSPRHEVGFRAGYHF
jgi:hypothetical protein